MKKLSFKTHLLIVMRETLLSAILSRKYEMILSTQQKILPLLLYFQKKGRKLQKMFLHLQMFLHLHLHPHWRQWRNNNLTLQDQESQRGRTLEGQPVHLVTFTCNRLKTLSRPGLVENQYNCYIVGLGPNCKFIDLLFKRSVLIFIKISSFIVSLFQKLFTVRQTHSQKN